MMTKQADNAYWALKLTYGLVPIVAGLDKFTNLLADWPAYVSPFVEGLLPFSAVVFMKVVGIIEIAAGALVLWPKSSRIGAYVVMAWLVGIAVNLVLTGKYFDVAVRDLTMAVGAFALAKLIEARAGATESTRVAPGMRQPVAA